MWNYLLTYLSHAFSIQKNEWRLQFNFGCENPPTACNLFKMDIFFKWLSLAVIRNIIYIIAVIFQAKLATTKKIKISGLNFSNVIIFHFLFFSLR